jgi:outer membrane lipase/esterase
MMNKLQHYCRGMLLTITVFVLGACGSSDNTQLAKPYTSLVSFGDSLSDVGTYAVGTVKTLGGGRYTVNGANGLNWVDLLGQQLKLPAACAARTGLDGDAAQGFKIPVADALLCTSYGQGGARVTAPVGPGNKALGGGNAVIGQLTEPVVSQIANHLNRAGGKFTGTEIVTLLAGGNDIFINIGLVGAASATPAQAVQAMSQAGTELSDATKKNIIAKGAKQVAVLLLPDVSITPFGKSQSTDTQALLKAMVVAFNTALQTGLSGSGALVIDTYAENQKHIATPTAYGLVDVSLPACDLSSKANPLGSALICSASNLRAGADVGSSLFADSVHPTPKGYKLVFEAVLKSMINYGW